MSTVDAAIINYITNGGSSGGGGGGGSGGGGESGGGGSSDVAKSLENEYGTATITTDGSTPVLQFWSKTRGVGVRFGHADAIDIPFAVIADYGSNYPELNIYSPAFELGATKNGQTGLNETTLRSTNFYIEGNLIVKDDYTFSAPNVYTKDEIDKINFVNKNHKITCRIEGLGIVIPAQPGGIPLGSVLIFKRADGKYMHYIFIEKSDVNFWISDGVATIPNIALYDSDIGGYKITYSGAQLDDSCGLFFKGSNIAINGTDANATMVYTDAEIYSMFHYLLNKINELSAGTS